ncbi:hypothetical protein Nm8I071_48930 [Nonomuraea sp. TT08I-71]|nr:hypothetical protein Nm8I071_48930 [Nonomuraea sp. TT08I-71]
MTDLSPTGPPPQAGDGGFAVVEMFTSQGCESCPPAEEVLTEIERDARKRGEPVFALGFHVDYWDHLGWPDPYAAAAYTARQEAYARAFGTGHLYTPQMVVNGTAEFVGSDRRRAAEAISSALSAPAVTPLALSVGDASGGHVTVDYRAQHPPARGMLHVAVVERGLENDVPRGENAGRRLRQDNVVRAFTSVGLDAIDADEGRVDLTVPPDLDPRQASVVGYVQQEGERAVVGAAAVDVSG